MLPRARPEPWMANAPKCPAKAASGRFCRSSGCVKLSIHKSEHLENIISVTRHRQSVIVSRYSEPHLQERSTPMEEQQKLEKSKTRTKLCLITITVLFLTIMLVVPLISVMASALKEGIGFYLKAISTEYVLSALKVTLIATSIAVLVNTFFGIWAAWLLTRFSFKGKQILATIIDIPFSISPVIVGLAYLMTFGRLGWLYPAIRAINDFFGTNIRITFAVPGVVLATIFVTFPFVSREIIPVLNAQGKDEEEAAALMGASGFTIFRKITLPQMKWGLIYGIILCTARALGEFGAVNALSKTRGETFTLPLEIDALYMSGTDSSITAAFAVSSILVIIALIILFVRNIVERRQRR